MAELTAGVDLGGTKIQAVVVADGRVVGQARLSTPRTDAAAVTAEVVASIRGALEAAGAGTSDLRAVGIGAPGLVDPFTGHVSKSPNVAGFMEEVALGPSVSRALDGIAVTVDNDVRAAVSGELHHGAGRPYRNFLGVFVGSGVGGGLVIEGNILRGNGNAGEIGHTTVRPGGRQCGCGRLGCLEAYAGRVSIERRARQHVQKGRKTKLFEIMERKGRDRVTSSVIADALEQQDNLTVELIDQAIESLGLALSNAHNLLDLEAIILGGGLGDRLGEPFARRVAAQMQENLRVPERPPAVLSSELGDLSGAVGATVITMPATFES
ncbi:MAG TPA: ROK family protein [Acidimicrobiales bacterium]|nr:ROK family protein [Acidimicrobiales bacterium]